MTTKEAMIEADKIAKGIIASIEEFMDNVPVSTAESAVKFWLCTGPNPVSGTKAAPREAVNAANDLARLLHPTELNNLIQKNGIEYEYEVMYQIYDHFYGKGHDDITPGHRKGCVFGGGFMLDLFEAKATGKEIKNIKRTWR